MRVVLSAWTVSRPILSAEEEGLARHNGHRPKNWKERTTDVDGLSDERRCGDFVLVRTENAVAVQFVS